MSTVTRPRGPLPQRVYWTRRAVVLGLALLLFVGVGKVLGGGGDGQDDGGPKASIVAGSPTSTPSATRTTPRGEGKKDVQPRKPRKTKEPLPQPSGPCAPSDVVVTPEVKDAHAGGSVAITLLFTTLESEACTFAVTKDSVVLKLTSGDDRIWSSQQCERAIKDASVIARKEVPGKVVVMWSGRRSNDECSNTADWAFPGYYHAEAAALGSNATDVQFRLGAAVAATITPQPKVKRRG